MISMHFKQFDHPASAEPICPKVVKYLSALRLPNPLPFSGVEFFPRESMRYTSRIGWTLSPRRCETNSWEGDGDSFPVMVLALAAGLRRGEIRRLLWRNVDFTVDGSLSEHVKHRFGGALWILIRARWRSSGDSKRGHRNLRHFRL